MASITEKFGDREPRRLFARQIVRKIFFEDWVLKLVALVITVALWLGVTGLSTPTTKRFMVPLNFSISNNSEITFSSVQEVDVVISGDKRRIDQIDRADLGASIDLTDVAAGDRILSLSPENVSVALPQGVRLDEIQPGRIAVRIETVEEKDVSVRAEIVGEPAEGFEVYGSTVTPDRIRVRGPVSSIKTLDSVAADPVDIAGATSDISARQVRVSNPTVAVLNTVVDVSVRIGEKRVERRFSVRADDPLQPEKSRTATVVLYGGKSLLDGLAQKDLRVQITYDPDSEATPNVILPPALEGQVEIRSVKLN